MATWRPPFFSDLLIISDFYAQLVLLRCSIPCLVGFTACAVHSAARRPASGISARVQRQRLRRCKQIFLERRPSFRPDDPAFVEIKPAGDLDLNRVGAVCGRAEMLGDESPGERLVAADTITRAL